MGNIDALQEQLLEAARAQARERLVIESQLVDYIAQAAVRELTAAHPDADASQLLQLMPVRIERVIAVYFRKQRAQLRDRGPASTSDGEALEYFVLGALDGASPQQHDVWHEMFTALSPMHQKLVRLMCDGVPQTAIADHVGYANADVVKVTVSRLRTKLRHEFVSRADT